MDGTTRLGPSIPSIPSVPSAPIVLWNAPPRVPGRPARRRTGAIIGGLIALVVSLPFGADVFVALFAATATSGIIGGWLAAPEIREHRVSMPAIAGLSAFSVIIGALIIGFVLSLGSWRDTMEFGLRPTDLAGVTGAALEIVGGAIGLAMLGTMLFGLPMLVVTGACALAWAAVLQFVTRRGL